MNLRSHIYTIVASYLPDHDEAIELSELLSHEVEYWGGEQLLNREAPEEAK